jgi:hypothetical protein
MRKVTIPKMPKLPPIMEGIDKPSLPTVYPIGLREFTVINTFY